MDSTNPRVRTAQAQSSGQTSNGRPHLSAEQHELLKMALGLRIPDDRLPDPRPAIREIVDGCGFADHPEQILVAFKNSLDEVANAARIPFGPERNDRLRGLVSAFIEEMFSRGPDIRDGACRGK
ncbi:MAG TPA: hypothetical protein VFS56_02785 [Gemmatimonadaceae bacterium]|nr:hypothetical protein [Gemmatimonadaceae bacterium]